jgi:hypothetical protein
MAVLLTVDLQVSRADVEAVSNEMGVRDNPPAGLIAHVVTDAPEGVHVVDLWESEADFRRFADEQLMPTFQRVLSARGVSLDAPLPEPTVVEAYDVVRGG